MKLNNPLRLIISVAVCELAGILGSVFTASSVSGWYATLIKPTLNPPAWIFGPVWTALYALMGVAFFLIWSFGPSQNKEEHSNILENLRMLRWRKISVGLFIFQLALNIFWSLVFFGLHNPGASFVEIIFLWFAILATIIAFSKISPLSSSIWTTEGHGKLAAWLLVPYILWVSFAAYLNYAIWILN